MPPKTTREILAEEAEIERELDRIDAVMIPLTWILCTTFLFYVGGHIVAAVAAGRL